jgi:phosphoenolpyruvate synthase/pyruvate phosphate dikinase
LAHVNVAARSRGTPNIYLKEASQDARVKPHLGKLVRFEVKNGAFTLAAATIEEAQAHWKKRQPQPVVLEFDGEKNGLLGFEEMGFEDARCVGVKAANLAELSKLLKDQAPQGFAIPFHYYDRFMKTAEATSALCDEAKGACLKEGRPAAVCEEALTLCRPPSGQKETLLQQLERLLGNDRFVQNAALREAALHNLRYQMEHLPVETAFAQLLNERISKNFGTTKVRLRSSTNSEDLEFFSGAGLYTSVSAYATGEKAASQQVRKVWASVWSWRAFEERGFWNIDHQSVRMGVAVHPAFPDEAANGVLITQNIVDPIVAGMYVNVQQGEVSVTNPEDGALPEIFSIIPAPSGIQIVRRAYSSLSPKKPILSDEEVKKLATAANKIQAHFAPLYQQDRNVLALDLEFKFHGPERALFIKQARPYVQRSFSP